MYRITRALLAGAGLLIAAQTVTGQGIIGQAQAGPEPPWDMRDVAPAVAVFGNGWSAGPDLGSEQGGTFDRSRTQPMMGGGHTAASGEEGGGFDLSSAVPMGVEAGPTRLAIAAAE